MPVQFTCVGLERGRARNVRAHVKKVRECKQMKYVVKRTMKIGDNRLTERQGFMILLPYTRVLYSLPP